MPFNPEILIPIFLFTFLFLLASRGMKNRHERRKWELTRGTESGDKSLTTSELEGMINDAVRSATSELEDRLERLERPHLNAPVDYEPSASKTLGRVQKSGL